MKNLKNELFLQELTPTEMQELNGGVWGVIIGVVCLASYLYDNRDAFMEGVKEGLNDFNI